MDYSEEVMERHRKEFGLWLEQQQNAISPRPNDRKFAKMINISPTQVGKMKRGLGGIRPETAKKIAEALKPYGVSQNEVFEKAGLPVNKEADPALQFARQIHEILGDMPEPARQSAEMTLKQVAMSLKLFAATSHQ